jgi:hypothetical protein
MPAQQQHYITTAYLTGTTGTVAAGTVLCFTNAATDRFVVATSANLSTYGQNPAGIALTAADNDTPYTEMQSVGFVPASITGLGAGAAGDICVNSSGALARGSSPDVVGQCDAEGNAMVNFAGIGVGGGGGGGTPGGSNGQIQYNNAGSFGGIALGNVGSVLRTTGATTAAFGQLDLDDADAFTGTLPLANQEAPSGTGFVEVTSGAWNGSATAYPIPVSKGGTNQTALGTALQVLRTNAGATDTEWATISSGGSSAGTNGQVQASDGAGGFVAIALGAVGSVLRTTGATTAAFGALDLADSDARTGALPVANIATGSNGHVLMTSSGSNTFGFVTNSNVDASAAIAVTKLATLTTGTFLGAPSGTNTSTNLATYYGVGTSTLSTVGGVRFDTSAAVMLGVRNTTNTADVVYLAKDASNNLFLGTSSSFNQQVGNVNAYAASAVAIGLGGTTYLYCASSQVQCWQPVAGTSLGSQPFRFASASIAQSTTSDTTLTASQYSCPILICTGTAGGSFNWIAPNTANAVFWVHNQNSSTMTFKRSGGTGVSLSSATSRSMVYHNGSDYAHLLGPVA